jgi:deoxyribonuclease-4
MPPRSSHPAIPPNSAHPAIPPYSPLGTHLSVRGHLPSVPARAAEMGADAVQIFLGNPRGWATPAGDPAADAAFRDGVAEHGLTVLVHSAYLINLGSPTDLTYTRSIASVAHALSRGAAVGASGVVVHTGSCVDDGSRAAAMRQVRDALLPMLDALPEGAPDLLLEPTAGQGQSLCAGIDGLDEYLENLHRHPRAKVCFDTCHSFAAGDDLSTPAGMTAALDRLADVIGDGQLGAVHANDSLDARGSFRDRHERIGAGCIGIEPFRALLAHPAVGGKPVVLETPGGSAAHAEDLRLLRSLTGRAAPL